MPIEYAIPKVHRFLEEEGIRDEITVMAGGGLRTPHDAAKAIALGADLVEIVDPYDLETTESAFTRMLESEGVAMVISRRACSTEAVRAMRPETPVPFSVDDELCTGCQICMSQFGCPALVWSEESGKAWVDSTICTGCNVCSQVCPFDAIRLEGS